MNALAARIALLFSIALPNRGASQDPLCGMPPDLGDAPLVRLVMARNPDSTPILATARASMAISAGKRIGVAIIRPALTDVDYVTVFTDQCASNPVLRGTGWAPDLTAEPIAQWNAFISRVDSTSLPIDRSVAKGFALLFLSFGTGRFVGFPADLGSSAAYSGRRGDEIVPVEVRDVQVICEGAKCRVSGVWLPAPGVFQRFWVILRGASVQMAVLDNSAPGP